MSHVAVQKILSEIAVPGTTRKDVAQTYRLILESRDALCVDWPEINKAIIARWSLSGLLWIKRQAWSGKCFVPKE